MKKLYAIIFYHDLVSVLGVFNDLKKARAECMDFGKKYIASANSSKFYKTPFGYSSTDYTFYLDKKHNTILEIVEVAPMNKINWHWYFSKFNK